MELGANKMYLAFAGPNDGSEDELAVIAESGI